jgi:hypothetical protein
MGIFDDDDRPSGIEAEVLSLGRLFQKPWTYRVPRFQRAYSWTLSEVGQLVEDLRASAARDQPYYPLGLVLAVRGRESGEVEIVDGQQRLSTLTLLLAYIATRVNDKKLAADLQTLINAPPEARRDPAKDGARPIRLRLRPADEEFFREGVWNPVQLAGLPDRSRRRFKLSDAQTLIATAAKTIVEALADLTAEELEHLARFVCRRAMFIFVLVQDRDAASMLFRVANDRGLDPPISAIIKSELLERSGLPEAEADDAAARWDELEDELGRAPFRELLELIPLIVTGKAMLKKGDLRLFRDMVLNQIPPAQFLRESAPRYAAILRWVQNARVDAGPASEEVNRRIRCMQNLRDNFWLAPAIRC